MKTTKVLQQMVNQLTNQSNARGVVMTLVAAVCLLLILPQGVMAEKHTVGPFTATSDNGWQSGFNTTASPYMSITTISNDASRTNGTDRYMTPQGTGTNTSGYVTFKAADGIYISSYSFGYYFPGTDQTVLGKNKSGVAYIYQGTSTSGTVLRSGRKVDPGTYSSSTDLNLGNVSFCLFTPSTPNGLTWDGVKNDVGISELKFNLIVPEIIETRGGFEEDCNMPKIKTKGGETAVQTFTINVADAPKEINDFECDFKNKNDGQKGAFTITEFSYSANVITVKFKYTASSATDWQESLYTADLEVRSKNSVDTKTYTIHINGAATDAKSANNLHWLISGPQYVNTIFTKESLVSSNSGATITFTRTRSSVADFDDYDQLRITSAGGPITLTATQPATDEVEGKTITFDLTAIKRTADFTYNPSGHLYTGKSYPNYATVTNDVNGTLPTITFKPTEDDLDDYLYIDNTANVYTKLIDGTTSIKITAPETDEWNAINIDHLVTIDKDPQVLPICMVDDAYPTFIKDASFCRKITDNGTVAVVEYSSSQISTYNGRMALRIGESSDRNEYTSTYEIVFWGKPDKLEFNLVRPTDGFYEGVLGINSATKNFTVTISEDKGTTSDFTDVYAPGQKSGDITDNKTAGIQLNENTRRIRITYTGVRYVYFTDFCITAKPYIDITPSTGQIQKSAEGTVPAAFNIEHFNMKNITIAADNSTDFVVTPSSLDNKHGLGYGQGNAAFSVDYKGAASTASTIIRLNGTTMADVALAEQTVTATVVHPTHYVQGIAKVGTGWGKVHIATDATVPDAASYVGGGSAGIGATMNTAVLDCGATGEGDTKTFTLRAIPDNTWQFAEWQTLAGDFISNDNPYVATETALSADVAHPTQYTYKAIFFKGYPSAPEFGLSDLDMGFTFSGGQIIANLQFKDPRYIERDNVTVTFEDVDGHAGESAVFSQNGQYNTGTKAVAIRFLPVGAHLTTKTYQAKAIVKAKNTKYDENGDFVSYREFSQECFVTATCYPAEPAAFTVPSEIDFGAPLTEAEMSQTHDLTLEDMVNVYGTPTISFNNSYFTADAYNATTHSFTIHYNTSNVTEEGLLTTTATVSCLNADGKATEHTTTIKIFIGKPDFVLSDLNLGTTTSGGDNLYGYLELGSANGIDPTQVTITITDKAGHEGESQYFSYLTENPEWAGEEDTEHDQYISTWNPSDNSFHITFVPSASTPITKEYQATVTITATNLKGTTTKTATLIATVNPADAASFTIAASYTFNDVQRNVTDTWNVVPTNMQNIVGSPDVTISGTNAAYFSYGGYNEETHTLTLNFTPLAVGGPYTATAAVTFNNRDGVGTTQNITLTGSCIASPAADFDVQNGDGLSVVTSSGVYYGDFYVGEAASIQNFYLANITNMKVGSTPTVSITPAGIFTAGAYNATTKSFGISFEAKVGMTSVQNAVATFTMLNNDDQPTTKVVPLSAFVVVEPNYDVEVIASDGTKILKQGTWAECLNVANTPDNAGCTLRLVKNVNVAAQQNITNTFTLDLNGKTLSAAINGIMLNVNGAGKILTIKDGKSGGKIQNSVNYNSTAIGVKVTSGSLMLKSGTIYVKNTYASKGAYAIQQVANTEVTILGGRVEVYGQNAVRGIDQSSDQTDNTTLTINSGEIYAEGNQDIYGICAYGKVNMNGGTVSAQAATSNARGIYVLGKANTTTDNCYSATLTIKGGTINATNTSTADADRLAYGIYFHQDSVGLGASTGPDKTHSNKASAKGEIWNATINATTNGKKAYGVYVCGSYNSKSGQYDEIKIVSSTINATANYYYSYGVYADAGVNTSTSAMYAARVSLTECIINAEAKRSYAYGVYGQAAQNTIRNNANYNGEYAVASTITINGGTITANAATSNAYAVWTSDRVKTTRSTTVVEYTDRDPATDALGALGGNKEAYVTLNITGGKYVATTGTDATAHTIRSGGNTTINGGEFESNAAKSSAVTLYVISGKTTVNGATLKATAKTDANAAYVPAVVPAYTLFAYAGDIELNNCNATVNTTETTNARGVYVDRTTRMYTLADFNDAKSANNSSYQGYGDIWQIGARAIAGKATINGGTYTVKAYTSNAYGVLLNTNALSTDGSVKSDGQIVVNNATFNVQALGTNGTGGTLAYGIQAGGKATIDGCTINATTKTTNARGVYSVDEKTTIANSTINATSTTSSAYGIIGSGEVANNGVPRVAEFELNAGNVVTAKANTEGAYAIYMTGTTGGAYSTAYFTGSMAVAASAVINGGKYTADATTKTAYALHVSGVQVKNEASATPSIIVNDGKFKSTSAATYADVSNAGKAGFVVLNGGYYVNPTNLNTYAASDKVVTALASTRTEYSEGYRYEIAPPGGNYVCQIGSTKYKTLEEALSVVTSGQVIYMIADYTLPAGDYILPSGATLMVPYKDGTGKGASTAIGASAVTTTSATTPTLFRKLTFASGANLTSFGIIETSAQQKANGAYGANVGMASGPYGQLELKEGSHIEMEDGSNLYCWGFVTGKGTINVKKGGNTLEGFQLGDWCGGTNASNLLGNSQKVFPITHYFFQSIECPITYRPGSTAKGSTHVNVSLFGVVGQDDISLVGTSGAMFLMTDEDASVDTWVMRDYDETTDQCVWKLNSGASIGNLTIKISTFSLESKNYDLPIASNMSIVMNYGTMSIGQNVVFLPGSKLIVNKEGTLDINGVSVVAYDTEDWTGTTRYYATYSPSWGTTNPRKNIALQDAEFFVHGKINIRGNGGVYTSTGGANIHSTNEDAGEVKYTTAATGDKTSYFLVQGGTNKTALTVNPARLKNEVADPAFSVTASTVAGKTWIYYDNQWQCWTQGDFCTYLDASNNPYAKPKDYVALNKAEVNNPQEPLFHDDATGTRGFIWDADCSWWEVDLEHKVNEGDFGVYQSIIPDHNGKYNYYEFDNDNACWKIKNVTVTFSGDGVTTTNYTNVGYGTSPKWLGATPTKSGYVWDGWTIGGSDPVYTNDNLPEVTSNTTFTSHFKPNPVKYNITFKNPDGKVLDSRNWESGSTPSYEGTPEREATVDKTYTWAGSWTPEITTVSAAKDYTAQYNETARQYDVTFLDYDNTELETKKVDYNATPAYTGDPSTPTREDPTDTYIYEFSGWKNQQTGTSGLAAVKGDQTYVAQYNHHQKWFNIRFVDYNGTTLKTGPVLRNTMPTPPANPTRESDAQYHYTFKAWSPAIATATANATYTATYNTTLRSYTIRFLNDNGEVLQTETLNYGVTPQYKGETPTNADESLEFVGWDDIMRSVTGPKDYTAQFTTKTYTVTVTSAGNGTATGGGVYSHGATATMTATPDEGYVFDQWNDGNNDNPRSLIVTETATYTATFVSDETGTPLDIVGATATSLTINANPLTLSKWPYTINGTSYGRTAGSGDEQCNADRTITITHDKDADAELPITVLDKNEELVSRHKYTIPHVYNSTDATLSGTDANSIVFINGGTLTINDNQSAKAIYVAAGAELKVEGSLNVEKLVLRTSPWAAAILTNKGTINATNTYYSRVVADNSKFYQFGLPGASTTTGVIMSDGSTPSATSWQMKIYSEADRAENGISETGANWLALDGTTIQGNKGYEIYSGSKYYREYYFPVNISEGETVSVQHTGDDAQHSGWNVVVSPKMGKYLSEPKPEDITICILQPEGGYLQEIPETIMPAVPFSYQAPEAGTLTFGSSLTFTPAVSPAPRRRVQAAKEETRIQWIHLDILSADGEGDQTSVYSHPTRYEQTYKTGIDVAKQSLTASRAILYSSHAYGDMAFAGVADTLLESGVALTVYSPKSQELTFSLRDNDWLNRMEYVWLIDKETGAKIDLLSSDYSYEAAEGTTRGRFFIQGQFKAPQIATELEPTSDSSQKGREIRKLIINQKMFIEVNGRLYDATGKEVKR